jgi:hypothetical protein
LYLNTNPWWSIGGGDDKIRSGALYPPHCEK